MGRKDRFITDARMLIGTIERDPAKLRAYHGEIERLIARCMDELHILAVNDGCRRTRRQMKPALWRTQVILDRTHARLVRGLSVRW